MSPAARGLLPGLFLALATAFAVLAANGTWLLPALDGTGVRYITTAPQLASGEAPEVPVAPWNATESVTGLRGEGKLVPLGMAAAVRLGARPYVAGLWTLALGAAACVLAFSWVVGGVAGPGALITGVLLLAATPLAVQSVTALGPDLVVAALVLTLLGAMTYRPTWSVLHGLLVAMAWLASPVGLGAFAAVLFWPLADYDRAGRPVVRLLGSAIGPALLIAVALRVPLLTPPAWVWDPAAAWRTGTGVLTWAAAGEVGMRGMAVGAAVLVAALVLVGAEARSAPRPGGPVHWRDPAAPDWLAETFRPAALLLAVGCLGAAMGAGTRELAHPGLPAAFVLTAAVSAAAWRWARREGGLGWTPVLVLAAWAAVGGWRASLELSSIQGEGRGVTAKVWVSSPVIRWVDNRAPRGAEIYATDPVLIFLQTGHGARTLPRGRAALAEFADRYARRPGPIVLTGPDANDARAAELIGRLSLVEVVGVPEGRVLIPADEGQNLVPAAR